MKQSGHLNASEHTGTGFPVTLTYGRTPPNKHGGMDRQQQHVTCCSWPHVLHVGRKALLVCD